MFKTACSCFPSNSVNPVGSVRDHFFQPFHSTSGNAVLTLLLFRSVAKAMVKMDRSAASQYPLPPRAGLFGPHLAQRGAPVGQD